MMLRQFMITEAVASVALDGQTQALGGGHRGYGCPSCGAPLRFTKGWRFTMPCCGYVPQPDELKRWGAAARMIDARAEITE